ncbi:MAG: integrase [Firmicutes bacterium]|nr:integrase [Bacillota bacterium]
MNHYNSEICSKYVNSVIGSESYASLSRKHKDYVRIATALLEYQTTGTISYRFKQKKHKLSGEIGAYINEFLAYRQSRNFSEDTLASNRLYLSRFHTFLESKGIKHFSELEQQKILDFINSLGFYSKATIHCTLSSIRVFFSYLNEIQALDNNISYVIPKDNYRKETKLPTTYTKEEIKRLLSAVDRGNPKGKRDYAMLLLAARLGLRASDICGMIFSNIIWEENLIVLIQQKTKKRIELPLLEEIGNAIIDYLKYGRPSSQLPNIFLKLCIPYNKLSEPTLHSIVSQYLNLAGIDNVSTKKHGPHALRHSLAGFLLEKKTPLPVISEVLGHSNTESTKSYLRIDLNALSQCALEVPPLNTSFYKNEVTKC